MSDKNKKAPITFGRLNNLSDVQRALGEIADRIDVQSKSLTREQIKIVGNQIESKEKVTYNVSQTDAGIAVPTDSDGGNESYTNAKASAVVKRNSVRVPYIENTIAPNSFTVKEVEVTTGITYSLSQDADKNLQVSVTDISGMTEDEGIIVLDVIVFEGIEDMRVIYKVYREKALKEYYLEYSDTTIKNGSGSISVVAKWRDPLNPDQTLTSGDVRILKKSDDSQVGGDYYSISLGSGDISGSLSIHLKDITTGNVFETLTLLDISDGSDGTDGKTVRLTASAYVVSYDEDGENPSPSGDITFTATAQNFTDPWFRFVVDGSDEGSFTDGATSESDTATLTIPSTYFSTAKTIRVGVSEGNQSELAFDTINIFAVQASKDGYFVHLDNESHTVPRSNTGTVDYGGSGTTISVYKGSTQLSRVASGDGLGQFSITAITPTGITAGTESGSGSSSVISDHSAITGDKAFVEYTISIEGLISVSKIQTITRTTDGDDGIDGIDGADGSDATALYPVSLVYDLRQSSSVPNASGEWALKDASSYDAFEQDFANIDNFILYKDDSSDRRMSHYYEYLANLPYGGSLYIQLVRGSNVANFQVTSITYGSDIVTLAVNFINATGSFSTATEYLPTVGSTTVYFNFSLNFQALSEAEITLGAKDADGDTIIGDVVRGAVQVDYEGNNPTYTDSYFDIVVIDEFGTTYQYDSAISATDYDKYTVKNIQYSNVVLTLSTVSNQARLTASAYTYNSKIGYSYGTMEIWIYRNGQERYLKTVRHEYASIYADPPMVGEIDLSASEPNDTLTPYGFVYPNMSNIVFLRDMIVGSYSSASTLIAQSNRDNMTIRYEPNFEITGAPETGDGTIRLYRRRAGVSTQIASQVFVGGTSTNLEATGQSIEEGDFFYVRIENDDNTTDAIDYLGTNTLRVEPD